MYKVMGSLTIQWCLPAFRTVSQSINKSFSFFVAPLSILHYQCVCSVACPQQDLNSVLIMVLKPAVSERSSWH